MYDNFIKSSKICEYAGANNDCDLKHKFTQIRLGDATAYVISVHFYFDCITFT